MKILLADDDEDSRELLKMLLERQDHDVVEAGDGQQAWKAFRASGPKVVISDWMMPGLDGVGLCRKIRAENASAYAYFILLSGAKTSKSDFLRAMDAGVDDFLLKPVDAEAFRVRLRVAQRIMSLTSRVDALESILPICCLCKRIKDGDGAYQPLETYFADRAPVRFTHGVCPECLKQRLPGKTS